MGRQQETSVKDENRSFLFCREPVTQNGVSPGNLNDENLNNTSNFRLFCGRNRIVQDGYWACVSLTAAAVVQFIVMGIHNSFGTMFQQIIEEFNWKESTSALIGSFAIGINFLISPVATHLCESYNPQVVTILGGIISIVGLLAASFVTTDYGMFLSYSVVWGTGSSLCYASTYVVVGKLFHKHLAFAMGFVTAGSGIGGLAMSPSIERMLEAFGWKTTMRALAILASCLIISAITYREPILSEERTSTTKSWKQLFDCSLWCIPAFSMLTVSLTIFNFGYYIPIIHVPNYATNNGFSKYCAALLISCMSMASVIARLVFGKLADHPRVNKLLIFQICLGIMALSTILCPFVSSEYAGFAVYMVIFGICEGCIVGTAPTLVAHIVGRVRISPALGLLFFSFAVPLATGAWFAGWLYTETNGYEKVFFVAGGTMILSFLLLCPVHCLSKAQADIHRNVIVADNENTEQNIELPNFGDTAPEINILLPPPKGDIESDSLKVSCNDSNDSDDRHAIL